MAKQPGKVARRYAKAMFNAVLRELGEAGSPTPAQQTSAAFSRFAGLWRQEPEFSAAILNPMFERSQRLKAVQRIAQESGLPDVSMRSLRVIFEHERVSILPEIADAFAELADKAAGIVQVDVAVAKEVPAAEMKEIELGLSSVIPGSLRFTWEVKPSLLGGIVVKYQGTVVDGSLSSRLEQIERILRG